MLQLERINLRQSLAESARSRAGVFSCGSTPGCLRLEELPHLSAQSLAVCFAACEYAHLPSFLLLPFSPLLRHPSPPTPQLTPPHKVPSFSASVLVQHSTCRTACSRPEIRALLSSRSLPPHPPIHPSLPHPLFSTQSKRSQALPLSPTCARRRTTRGTFATLRSMPLALNKSAEPCNECFKVTGA